MDLGQSRKALRRHAGTPRLIIFSDASGTCSSTLARDEPSPACSSEAALALRSHAVVFCKDLVQLSGAMVGQTCPANASERAKNFLRAKSLTTEYTPSHDTPPASPKHHSRVSVKAAAAHADKKTKPRGLPCAVAEVPAGPFHLRWSTQTKTGSFLRGFGTTSRSLSSFDVSKLCLKQLSSAWP